LGGSVLFVSTESTAANFVLFTHKAAVHSYNFDAKRAPLAFAFPKGSCGPGASAKRRCSFSFARRRYKIKGKRMLRVMAWYLLERIIRIPAEFLMRLHLIAIKKVRYSIRKNRQKMY